MYLRKFSLNKPNSVLKYGLTYESNHFICKYLGAKDTEQSATLVSPRFCIIISNRFSKRAVTRNSLKRAISYGISESLALQLPYDIVIIPKKNLLGQNGKISVDVKTISLEIHTFLSELAVLRSR